MREAVCVCVCVCVNVVKRAIDHTHVSSSVTVPTYERSGATLVHPALLPMAS